MKNGGSKYSGTRFERDQQTSSQTWQINQKSIFRCSPGIDRRRSGFWKHPAAQDDQNGPLRNGHCWLVDVITWFCLPSGNLSDDYDYFNQPFYKRKCESRMLKWESERGNSGIPEYWYWAIILGLAFDNVQLRKRLFKRQIQLEFNDSIGSIKKNLASKW